ncbi:hypothetical protein GCK72_020587 [Caenorhabditis remanei]|uniref:NR LBD domain-containing protein n=1 Tax=Caenorhabditis remanei TaxID=31234 RepID=A0A6A5GHV9_CAERE|nr:hypothetical protein GCK72_020587 [Caenorhabditis remanei]KAF1754029.1 hypothetical protein GCK72_020587 [Caenorhabditis remanei]
MTFNPYSPTFDLHNNEVILFAIINNLQHIDNHREKLFNNCLFNGDPSFTEVLGTLNFEEKPPDLNYTYKEWSFIQSITGIDFLKKISFMAKLTLPDQIVILKNIFIQFNIFSIAHSCYTTKLSRLSFPNGSEIPEPNIYGVSDNLRIRIQGRLLARLIELKVSKPEFLLVSVMLLCDPCAPNLSDHGKILITSQQKYYASALLQHCLINYQNSGPSRFTDLLFLPQAIFSTIDDLKAHYQLCQFYQTSDRLHTKKIFLCID